MQHRHTGIGHPERHGAVGSDGDELAGRRGGGDVGQPHGPPAVQLVVVAPPVPRDARDGVAAVGEEPLDRDAVAGSEGAAGYVEDVGAGDAGRRGCCGVTEAGAGGCGVVTVHVDDRGAKELLLR